MALQITKPIEVVYWDDVSEQVAQIRPELATIINELNPGKQLPLVKASYPFGTKIRDNGAVQLPTDSGRIKSLATYPNDAIKKLLHYNSSPIAFVLDKTVEFFVKTPEGRAVPFKLFTPGSSFGVWGIMAASPIRLRRNWDWTVTAGARNVFMLPSINDSTGHARLHRAFKIKAHSPNNIYEHHQIFTEIANAQQQTNPWYTEILFFTREWLVEQPHNIGWVKLREYWAKQAWSNIMHWSNKLVIDFCWEPFIAELTERKIRLKPYLLDTVKHLVSIGCGTIPGFKPLHDNEMIAPVALLQKAYIEEYGLKPYAPILMYPDYLNPNDGAQNLYYSLQNPTLPEKPPLSDNVPSAMKQLRELKEVMDVYLELASHWLPLEQQSNHDFIESVHFDYFHTEVDKYKQIQNSDRLMAEDSTFQQAMSHFPERELPYNASFFRGCVRIGLKGPD